MIGASVLEFNSHVYAVPITVLLLGLPNGKKLNLDI